MSLGPRLSLVTLVLVVGCYPVHHVDTVIPDPDLALSKALLGVWVLVDTTDRTTGQAAAVIEFASDSVLQINYATDEGAAPLMARAGRLGEFTALELWQPYPGEEEASRLNPWPRPRILGVYLQRVDTLLISFFQGDELIPTLERVAAGQFLRRSGADDPSTSDEVLLTAATPGLRALYLRLAQAVELDVTQGVRYVRVVQP